MALIDVDKFVCSIISSLDNSRKNTVGLDYVQINGVYQFICEILKDQGIIYKDGSLIKIGSKKCEGTLGKLLEEKRLANSCESCKDSQPLQIEKGKWYMCLRSQKGFVKGCCYKSNMDKCLEGDNAYMYVGADLGDFRLATEEEIKVNNGGISVDIDKMCYEYISNLDSLLLDPNIIAHKKYSYRQGILDTLELIKIGWL